jgi:uncharacterized lipoprotein YmbA
MKKLIIIALLGLSGCATSLPTPPPVQYSKTT